MTITTSIANQPQGEFSRRPATSKVEAIATVGVGVGLATYAILRRTWTSAALGLGGAYLTYCGVSEFRRPYQGRVRKAHTIARKPEEIYEFIRTPSNWNRFLHAIRIQPESDNRFRLKVGEAAGMDLVSQIQITDEKLNEYIAWSSTAGEIFEHRGVIHFRKAPADRGTEVSVALEYKAPAGPVARSLASLVGWNPEQMVNESVRHLKQIVEAGEIPTTAGQPVGKRGMKGAALRVLYREGPTEDATEAARLAGD